MSAPHAADLLHKLRQGAVDAALIGQPGPTPDRQVANLLALLAVCRSSKSEFA